MNKALDVRIYMQMVDIYRQTYQMDLQIIYQTDRLILMDKKIHRHVYQIDRYIYTEIQRQINKKIYLDIRIDRWIDRQIDRQINRQIDRQIDRLKDRYKDRQINP